MTVVGGRRRWWVGARPRTLPAAVAPVLVGTALAAGRVRTVGRGLWPGGRSGGWGPLVGPAGHSLLVLPFVCALGVALFVQIATNYANDYHDGTRGTDDPATRVGPPRLVGNGLATPAEVKRATIIAFGLTAACGAPLVVWVDWRLALVGVAAVAAGWGYTGGPRPYGYAGLGEAFVFVFFGLVATGGSYYVQTGAVTTTVVVAGAAMGALATALLVVNNLRDIPGDTASGKRTLAVRLGDGRTRWLYVACLVAAFACVPVIAGLGARPAGAVALMALPLAQRPVTAVLGGTRGRELISVLAATGRVQMVFGALLAVGVYLSV